MSTKTNKANQSFTKYTTQLNETFNVCEWYTRGQHKYISRNEHLQYNHNVYAVPVDITVENIEKNIDKKTRICKNTVRRHSSSNSSTISNSSSLKSTVSEFQSHNTEKLSSENDLLDFLSLKERLRSPTTFCQTADEDENDVKKYRKLNNVAHSETAKKQPEKRNDANSTIEEKTVLEGSSGAVLSKFTNQHRRFNAPRMTDDELIVIESMLRVQQAMTKYVLVAQLTSAVGQAVLTSGISAAWSVPSIMHSAHHRIACKKHYAQCQDEISSRGLELAPLEEKSFAKRAFAIALGSGFVCCVLPIAMDMILDGAVVELVSNFFSDKVLLGLENIIHGKGASLTGGQPIKGSNSHNPKSNDTLIAKLKAYAKPGEIFHRQRCTKQIAYGRNEDEDWCKAMQREAANLFSCSVEIEDEKSLDDSSSDEDHFSSRKSASFSTKKSLLKSFDGKSQLIRWGKKVKNRFCAKKSGLECNDDTIPKYYIVSEEERMAWQHEAESLFGSCIVDDSSPFDYSDKQNSTSRRLSESNDDSETDAFTLFGINPDKLKATQPNRNTRKQNSTLKGVEAVSLYSETDELSHSGMNPDKMEVMQLSKTTENQKPSRKTVETSPLFAKDHEDELNRVISTSLRGTHLHCNNYETEQKINEVIRTTMLQAACDSRIRDAMTLFSADDARDIVDIVTLTLDNCTDPELIDRNGTYYF